MPHARLGETVCAYVIPRPGATVTLEELDRSLQAARVARQKCPEALVIVDDFPKTASGKIRKDLLRKDAAARHGGGA